MYYISIPRVYLDVIFVIKYVVNNNTLQFSGSMRDDYVFSDVHPDAHHRNRGQHYHSPTGSHPHTSSAKPNHAFFNTSPSNSPIHDDMRQGHNDSYHRRKQTLSPKSSHKPYHPSKHNGSTHPDRYGQI